MLLSVFGWFAGLLISTLLSMKWNRAMELRCDENAAIYVDAEAIRALSVLSRAEVTQGDVERVRKEAALDVMKAVATTFGIDSMKIRIEKQKELGREMTDDEEMEEITLEIKMLREEPRRDPRLLVKEGQLQRYLEEGWQFVSVLPSQRILIRK